MNAIVYTYIAALAVFSLLQQLIHVFFFIRRLPLLSSSLADCTSNKLKKEREKKGKLVVEIFIPNMEKRDKPYKSIPLRNTSPLFFFFFFLFKKYAHLSEQTLFFFTEFITININTTIRNKIRNSFIPITQQYMTREGMVEGK